MTLNNKRIACIIVAFLAAVAALTMAIILNVNSDSVCVPLYVISGVTLLYSLCYIFAHCKSRDFWSDFEMAFIYMVVVIVAIAAIPLVLILWVVEKIVDAISERNSQKELKSLEK